MKKKVLKALKEAIQHLGNKKSTMEQRCKIAKLISESLEKNRSRFLNDYHKEKWHIERKSRIIRKRRPLIKTNI